MTVQELSQLLDASAVVVLTDGMKDTMRCIVADIPKGFLRRKVDFLAVSEIGGLHLRIVVSTSNIFEIK